MPHLTIEVNQALSSQLEQLAKELHATDPGEVVLKALGLLALLHAEREKGAQIYIENEKEGTRSRISQL